MKTRRFLHVTAAVCLMAIGHAAFAQQPGQQPGGLHSQTNFGPAAAMPMSGMGVAPIGYYDSPSDRAGGDFLAPVVLPADVDLGGGDAAEICTAKSGGEKGSKCGCARCCLSGGYDGHLAFYTDFLYMRTRDAEVAYAVPFDGPIGPGQSTVQVGPVGVADMDFQPSLRAGFEFIVNPCAKFSAVYTIFESGTTDQVSTQAPTVVRSIVGHPGTNHAGETFLQADAQYDINFDLFDIDVHQLLSYCENYQLAYVIGVRVAQQEQKFESRFAGNTAMRVDTDIDFYGAGVRGGLEYDRYFGCRWNVYVRGYGSLVPGEFRADFDQSQAFDNRVIDTGWKGGRVVTMWDLELGTGWTSKCGFYSLELGYVFSAWTNVVQTDEWIRGVQSNSFIDMDSTMTFDGLAARCTIRH